MSLSPAWKVVEINHKNEIVAEYLYKEEENAREFYESIKDKMEADSISHRYQASCFKVMI